MYPSEQLVHDHPRIFSQLSYLEVADGWLPLVRLLCDNIQELCDSDPDVEQVVAGQVKQKFRGLRFYYHPCNDKVDALIDVAEALAYQTCEGCGATVSKDREGGGYGQVACAHCDAKWKEQREKRRTALEVKKASDKTG